MIEARDLVKRFGPLTAVNKVNFRVEPGEILGFLGPNGAGKSTTMKLITGYLRPDGGTARIGGYDIRDNPLGAKEMFGYLPESGPLYPEMTVREFLAFAAELHGLRGAAKEEAFHRAKDLCHLESVLCQTLETLSKGYRQRVGLAQAVLHDPRYLILDEPTDGLDPNQKREVRKLIKGMAEKKAILLSTHILEEVEAMHACPHHQSWKSGYGRDSGRTAPPPSRRGSSPRICPAGPVGNTAVMGLRGSGDQPRTRRRFAHPATGRPQAGGPAASTGSTKPELAL